MHKKPLEGIKILDFTWVLVGPLTTRTLALYGAEVLKIESRTRPGICRLGGPFRDGVRGLNRSGRFNWANTGKLSLSLNLARTKGLEIAKRLVAWADVVIDNFTGGKMKKMGLGYEELKKLKPDIIMLSSCMQGQTGPHAASPGLGNQLTALAGFNHITGWPDQQPVATGAYTDFIAPHFNIVAIMAALLYRRRMGKGLYIDVSQYENAVHFMAPLVLDNAINHRVAKRIGNRYLCAAPHGAYRCRGEDRWCAIAVFTDEEWKSFCRVIGDPAWTKDPRFTTLLARKENEEDLDKLVEEWTINYTAKEVMTMMQAAGVGAGMLETVEDIMEHDPHLKQRHFFYNLEHPGVGTYRAPRPAFLLSKSPYEMKRAPLLGEHNEYILKGILGMSDEEISELVIEGVIE